MVVLEVYKRWVFLEDFIRYEFYIDGKYWTFVNLNRKPDWFLKWHKDAHLTELRECGTVHLVFNFKVDELIEINESPRLGTGCVSQKNKGT
jgi:hypothetical protein